LSSARRLVIEILVHRGTGIELVLDPVEPAISIAATPDTGSGRGGAHLDALALRRRLRRARQIQEPPGDQTGETVLERIERDNLLSLPAP
jgi:hypothetical protein